MTLPPGPLLATEPGWRAETDVVVVGSGIAGLTTALHISQHSRIHHLDLPDRPSAPVMNPGVYELSDGLVTAWRDYTKPVYARELLRGRRRRPAEEPTSRRRATTCRPGSTALFGVRGGAQSRNALLLQENRSCLGIHSPEPKGIRSVRVCRGVSATFDDPNLVSCAGFGLGCQAVGCRAAVRVLIAWAMAALAACVPRRALSMTKSWMMPW